MSFSLAILTFLNVWCVMLFFTFAFGIQKNDDGLNVAYAAAPKAQNWKKRMLVNTFASLIVTLIFVLIVDSGMIPMRGMLDTL